MTAGAALRSPASAPGRICPVSYRYAPRSMNRPPEIVADTVYVVGGLYGNVEALAATQALAEAEVGDVTFVFNGDFHWFDAAAADFAAITTGVRPHPALRGNVETEIAAEDSGAGCGCAYPLDVSDAEVSRSNEILARLRATAKGLPAERERLAALPMNLVAQVGGVRAGIVHGDAASLAGWGFAHDRLEDPAHARWIESAFRDANVDVFASTHTCLPAYRRFDFGVVANNGAAGMPNFEETRFGIVTRLSVRPAPVRERVFGLQVRGIHVDALRVAYDHERWVARFVAAWPAGSPAHLSYFRRITEGPRFPLAA